ncbi:YqeB family protein [Brevibacillus borstelensis]|uniref:YqeB family protein n=1 Tax=Brevibacillus borstelensis TaxID=45462 RepID=UPI0030BEBF36
MEKNTTVLGMSKSEKSLIIVVCIILGAAIGWFLPIIADWVLKLPVVPFEKLFIFIASFHHFWVSVVASIVGVIAGFILSLIVFSESLTATVSDHQLKLVLGDSEKIIEKKDIYAVYMDNKNLVVLGQSSQELYREVFEIKSDAVRGAFHKHGYPWHEGDPFISEYQRWADGHPDFPSGINALLGVRERALKEEDKKTAKYLREDLAQLGVVIRDDRNGQYVRLSQGTDRCAK